jgi:hypothetical protein
MPPITYAECLRKTGSNEYHVFRELRSDKSAYECRYANDLRQSYEHMHLLITLQK